MGMEKAGKANRNYMAIDDNISDWQIVIPMVQMQISNDPPIGGCWKVGDICFQSKEMTEQFLKPPNVFSAPTSEQQQWILQKSQAFAVVQRQGRQNNLMKAVFKEVRRRIRTVNKSFIKNLAPPYHSVY